MLKKAPLPHLPAGLAMLVACAAGCSSSSRFADEGGMDSGVDSGGGGGSGGGASDEPDLQDAGEAPSEQARELRELMNLGASIDELICKCAPCADSSALDPTPAELACNDLAVTEHAGDFDQPLSCLTDALEIAHECVAMGECDVDVVRGCLMDLMEDEAACPMPPIEAIDALQACEEPRECGFTPAGDIVCQEPDEIFTCDNGRRIPATWRCDLEADCREGEDEQDCPPPFTCGSGDAIPDRWRCDGIPDCFDASDEAGC